MQAIIDTNIEQAVYWLTKGEVVGIPTETVYGLAGNALSEVAISKIYEVKQRPTTNPLIVHVASAEEAWKYTSDIPPMAVSLAEAFWPGPLTLLLARSKRLPGAVTAHLSRVAIRVPAHPLLRQLLALLPFPLAAPSANPSGYISPTTAQHVYQQLGDRIPYILDGGPTTIGLESTIIGFDEEERPRWYRLGGISLERVKQLAGEVLPSHMSVETTDKEKLPAENPKIAEMNAPQSPGRLSSHYAPDTPLMLGDVQELLEQFTGERVGVLAFQRAYEADHMVRIEILSPSGDLEEAGQRLFAALRRLDEAGVDRILAEPVPEVGIGSAINDRLRRAQADRKHG